MLGAKYMRQVADEACTDDEFEPAMEWLYSNVLREAEHGNTMFVHRVDMNDPTENFKLCLTRLKREFEEAGYTFRMHWNENGRPCRIEIIW